MLVRQKAFMNWFWKINSLAKLSIVWVICCTIANSDFIVEYSLFKVQLIHVCYYKFKLFTMIQLFTNTNSNL